MRNGQTLTDTQGGSDKAIGGGLVVVSAVVFTYYTTWAILLVRCQTRH